MAISIGQTLSCFAIMVLRVFPYLLSEKTGLRTPKPPLRFMLCYSIEA